MFTIRTEDRKVVFRTENADLHAFMLAALANVFSVTDNRVFARKSDVKREGWMAWATFKAVEAQ